MPKVKVSDEQLQIIHNEVRLAVKRNDNELIPRLQQNLARYTGEYIPDIGMRWDIVLNEIYPVIQNNLPSIFYKNPKVFLKPRHKTFIAKRRDPNTEELVEMQLDSEKAAKTQEGILNYTLEEIDYKKEIRKVLLDALIFPHGILWHGYKGSFGMTEEQSYVIKNERVWVKRLSPSRFIFDPAVGIANLDEARWIGRIIDIPLDDLLEDDDLYFDMKKIKGFQGYGDIINQHKKGGEDILNPRDTSIRSLIDYADSEYKKSTASKFVRTYEIFKRPTKKEKKNGEKGKILLLTEEQQKPLRTNSWVYKAEGWPAEILQFNELPDSSFGLDDISTYGPIADNKNIIRNLQIRNAQESSKVWVALAKDGTSEEDIEKIEVGDQTIILFNGDSVAGKMQVAAPSAGASNELYLLDQRLDRELMDKSGVSDLKRGFAQSGEESATSIRARVAGGSVRPQYRQDIMADFLKRSCHYINQLLKQFMPYKDAVRVMGTTDIEWTDIPSKEELQADTDVEIDVVSMTPESPEKEMQELNTILNFMTQALSNPVVMQKIQSEGFMFNFYPIVNNLLNRLKIRNPEVFRRIRQEEGMGFASVQQMKAAHANVLSVIMGKEIPFPPKETDDHRTFVEIYAAAKQLMEAVGQPNPAIDELLQIHAELQQMLESKEAPKAGQSAPPKT